METDTGPAIKLASTEELIDELGYRHDGVVVMMCGNVPGKKNTQASGISWRGGAPQAYGLICEHKLRIEAMITNGKAIDE